MSENSDLLNILKSEKGMDTVPSKTASHGAPARRTPRTRGSYDSARLVIAILTFAGYLTIAVGGVSALVGMFQFEHIVGAASGVYLMIAGIFQLGFAQLLMAIVNTAIDTRAIREALEETR